MRHSSTLLLVGTLLGQLAPIDFAKAAVPRALNYEQGNRSSLIDAQDDFTPEGWGEFMKWLQEYVDDKGAPTASSVFTSTGDIIVTSQEAGAIRLAIQGMLRQQSKNAYGGLFIATYRVTVDVELAGNPPRIRHLKTTTCGAKPCAR
jgi:hypothetical protein